MVVGFTTTYAISAYHHWSCEFKSYSWQGVFDTTLCDKVCQWLVISRWFSPGTPVSSTSKTFDDITEILLKVALNTTNQTHLATVYRYLQMYYDYQLMSRFIFYYGTVYRSIYDLYPVNWSIYDVFYKKTSLFLSY